jgi:hypothetical protein
MVARAGRLTQQFSASLPNSPQNRMPVLRHPDHMILAVQNGMVAALVRFHPTTLRANPPRSHAAKGVGFPDALSERVDERQRSPQARYYLVQAFASSVKRAIGELVEYYNNRRHQIVPLIQKCVLRERPPELTSYL